MTAVARPNIGPARLALGILSIAGWALAMWFSALGNPLVYGSVVVVLSVWIGLWPFREPTLGRRLLVACMGSTGICVVLLIAGEAIAFVRRDGLEELGPVLFVPVFVAVVWLPVTALAALVAAIGPLIFWQDDRANP